MQDADQCDPVVVCQPDRLSVVALIESPK